jgi:D-arginine utilization repressor
MKQNLFDLLDAVHLLFSPLAEIVVHDQRTQKNVYIAGSLSGRKVGQDSLLASDVSTAQDYQRVVYPKVNFDGKLVKSISVKWDDETIICINCDISQFETLKSFCEKILINQNQFQPQSLFQKDWHEKIHVALHHFLAQENLSFRHLKQKDKRKFLKVLFDQGAFEEMGAADYLAEKLEMGRATIFNYLREWRQK